MRGKFLQGLLWGGIVGTIVGAVIGPMKNIKKPVSKPLVERSADAAEVVVDKTKGLIREARRARKRLMKRIN